MINPTYKAGSYRIASTGKWVPSGTVKISGDFSTIAYTKTYKGSARSSKKAADSFFVEKVSKKTRKK